MVPPKLSEPAAIFKASAQPDAHRTATEVPRTRDVLNPVNTAAWAPTCQGECGLTEGPGRRCPEPAGAEARGAVTERASSSHLLVIFTGSLRDSL
jgi:hypothetical protein